MRQAIVKKGKVFYTDTPAPELPDNSVFIKVFHSCISPGTEITGVQASGKPILQKAMEKPEKVRKLIQWLSEDGLSTAYKKYQSETEIGNPTGYSASGIVLQIGKSVKKIKIGDIVAATGGTANHADYIVVPENLLCIVPKGLDSTQASTVAIGAIALHGVHRACLTIGELAVVFGTGLIGLITIQILRSAGVRVAAIDINNQRLEMAKDAGAEKTSNPAQENSVDIIQNWSGGMGVDAVLFTAATGESKPLSDAFQMCRRKGKLVLIGTAGMQIDRKDIYPKEIDFLISSSYGPGRYDMAYEQEGVDYPYAFVRWTENRNMAEYLRLLKSEQVSIKPYISSIIEADELEKAFSSFETYQEKPLCVILQFNDPEANITTSMSRAEQIVAQVIQTKDHKLRVGIVGFGGFTKSIILPNLNKLSKYYEIEAAYSHSGYKAGEFATLYKIPAVVDSFETMCQNPDIDMVIISNNHASHGQMVLQSLKYGKHVYVEKPLAINSKELEDIENFYKENANLPVPILMVGYNRRFSPLITSIQPHIQTRVNPLMISYRMNAGRLPDDHWIHREGGRIIGEACHIIDLFTYLTNSEVSEISNLSISPTNTYYHSVDNQSILFKFADGSVAHLQYFSTGNKQLSKEYMEIHFDGKSILLDDYQTLTGFGIGVSNQKYKSPQKGHIQELEYFAKYLLKQKPEWPIPLWQLLQTTKATFLLNEWNA